MKTIHNMQHILLAIIYTYIHTYIQYGRQMISNGQTSNTSRLRYRCCAIHLNLCAGECGGDGRICFFISSSMFMVGQCSLAIAWRFTETCQREQLDFPLPQKYAILSAGTAVSWLQTYSEQFSRFFLVWWSWQPQVQPKHRHKGQV